MNLDPIPTTDILTEALKLAEHGFHVIPVKPGSPAEVIRKYIEDHGSIAALVLSTAKEGGKNPLVSHFAVHANALPCPVYIVPGNLTREQLDELA